MKQPSLYGSRCTNDMDATKVTLDVLRCAYRVTAVGSIGDSVVVQLPFVVNDLAFFPFDESNCLFGLSDNGGEIVVWKINNSRVYADVPFDTTPPVTAELCAYRLATVMAGKEIDWTIKDMPALSELKGEAAGKPFLIVCDKRR